MSTEEKVSWIEKGLDRNTNAIQSLTKQITTIETYFKVVFAVAAVLGISGALLFSKISSVSEEIDDYKTEASGLQVQIDQLQQSAASLKSEVQSAKEDALAAIGSTGAQQKEALTKVISSVTAADLANGVLRGSLKSLLVRNCGGSGCNCPGGWSKAQNVGGNGDLNKGAKGDFIYICVQYH